MVRTEYPRPQFVREEWLCLNGDWQFAFDDENKGLHQQWHQPEHRFEQTIVVPYAYQSLLSGINLQESHDYLWYKKEFTLPSCWEGKEIYLHFGAVDYHAMVFVNGSLVGEHTGGQIGFLFEISRWLQPKGNQICVRVHDPSFDEYIPRGKQAWTQEPHSIWYTRTSGIWQSVWLEPRANTHIEALRITPFIDQGVAQVEITLSECPTPLQLAVDVFFQGRHILQQTHTVQGTRLLLSLDVFENMTFRFPYHGSSTWCWSPEHPNLFDITLELKQKETVVDNVTSYFGMRKIHAENGIIYLNNHPYYQKLVLDQGYWPDGLLTAPEDADFVKDITLAKEMGFNGCRKHQKVEDPRFLYWADTLGFLVWGEIASIPAFSFDTVPRLTKEFMSLVRRDYNHPCIVTWVPLNESWGVMGIRNNKKMQHHSLSLYHTIHALDSTRLVISNDGWEMTTTDICGIHNYRHGSKEQDDVFEFFKETLFSLKGVLSEGSSGRAIYAKGFSYAGEPVMLTEFGGIAYAIEDDGWGYSSVETGEEFLADYKRVVGAVQASKVLVGYCYTQLTDVEQEINGLLTYDRKPKVALDEIRRINEQWSPPIPTLPE